MSRRDLWILIAGIMLLFSCKKEDECDANDCQNGGICQSKKCVCEQGYEGVFCDTVSIDKFLGNFDVTEDCSSGAYTYNSTINGPLAEVYTLSISNFANSGTDVIADVSENSLTLRETLVGDIMVSGVGSISLSTGTVVITYTGEKNDQIVETCSATFIPE